MDKQVIIGWMVIPPTGVVFSGVIKERTIYPKPQTAIARYVYCTMRPWKESKERGAFLVKLVGKIGNNGNQTKLQKSKNKI